MSIFLSDSETSVFLEHVPIPQSHHDYVTQVYSNIPKLRTNIPKLRRQHKQSKTQKNFPLDRKLFERYLRMREDDVEDDDYNDINDTDSDTLGEIK